MRTATRENHCLGDLHAHITSDGAPCNRETRAPKEEKRTTHSFDGARGAPAPPLCAHVPPTLARLSVVSASEQIDPAALRGASVRLPRTVAFRALAAETVILDLSTGLYHHLDARTGELLEALVQTGRPSLAARGHAAATGRTVAAVEAELCALCLMLAERGLLDVSFGTAP